MTRTGKRVEGDAGPLVRLLGSVRVEGARGARPNAPGRMTEVVAWLALHPGSGPDDFTEAIWPDGLRRGRSRGMVRNQYLAQARKWLGYAQDGHPFVPLVTDGRGYRLAGDVRVDWGDFLDLAPDPAQAATEDLDAALGLVAGRPLSGLRDSGWEWAMTDKTVMCDHVARVALERAHRAAADRQWRRVQVVASQGLDVDPWDEDLHALAVLAGQHGYALPVARAAGHPEKS